MTDEKIVFAEFAEACDTMNAEMQRLRLAVQGALEALQGLCDSGRLNRKALGRLKYQRRYLRRKLQLLKGRR